MSDQYYCFFQGDYLRDTADLTLIEHGAYHLLLHEYYTKESLPAEPERLYRVCRAMTPAEKAAVDTVVARYFKQNGHGNLLNDKAEKEIARRRAFLSEQSRKGKLSARKRWGDSRLKITTVLTTVKPGLQPELQPELQPDWQPGSNPPSPSPSLSIKKKKTHTGENFELPEWMPEETWSVFLSHRKAVKAPVIEKAYPAFIEKFLRLKAKGWNPKEVVDVMIEKGWRWFKPEWVEKDQMKRDFGDKGTKTMQNLKDWLDEGEDKDHEE